MNHEVTINCINSILKFYSDNNIFITIIDNSSPNNSFKIIKNCFCNKSNISFIENSANLGFSKANNIGICFSKEKHDPDFYIVINSDIEFIQENFLDNIKSIYLRTSFDILGPDILCFRDGVYLHTSPHSLSVPNMKNIKKRNESLLLLNRRKYLNHINLLSYNLYFSFWRNIEN